MTSGKNTKGEVYLTYILAMLKDPTVNYTQCRKTFSDKFGVKRDETFSKYWKQAQDIHKETLEKAQKEIENKTIASYTEAAEKGLNDRNKIALLLYENFQRLREIKAGVTMTVQDVVVFEGVPMPFEKEVTVTHKEEISSLTEQRQTLDMVARLYDLFKDSEKGGKVVVTINSDGIQLQSDEI